MTRAYCPVTGLFKTRNSERVKIHASQIKCFATHTKQNRLSAAAAGRQWGHTKQLRWINLAMSLIAICQKPCYNYLTLIKLMKP